jgi:hypothetical protein
MLSECGFAPISILLAGDFDGWNRGSISLEVVLGSAMALACPNLSVYFHAYPYRMGAIVD